MYHVLKWVGTHFEPYGASELSGLVACVADCVTDFPDQPVKIKEVGGSFVILDASEAPAIAKLLEHARAELKVA